MKINGLQLIWERKRGVGSGGGSGCFPKQTRKIASKGPWKVDESQCVMPIDTIDYHFSNGLKIRFLFMHFVCVAPLCSMLILQHKGVRAIQWQFHWKFLKVAISSQGRLAILKVLVELFICQKNDQPNGRREWNLTFDYEIAKGFNFRLDAFLSGTSINFQVGRVIIIKGGHPIMTVSRLTALLAGDDHRAIDQCNASK